MNRGSSSRRTWPKRANRLRFSQKSLKYTSISPTTPTDSEAEAGGNEQQEANEEESQNEDETSDEEAELTFQQSLRRRSADFQRTFKLAVQNEEESKLFELVELGDVNGIRALLITADGTLNGGIDINKPNLSGYTVLHLAIQRGDENLVELLLKFDQIDIQDTLFYAIKEQNIKVVKMIIQHEAESQPRLRSSLRRQGSTNSEKASISQPTQSEIENAIKRCTLRKNTMESSEFGEDITPVILAAQVGSYELIKFFYENGDYLPPLEEIHGPDCTCEACTSMGSVRMAFKRLHYFQAISNSSHIIFYANKFRAHDPIEFAFKLIEKLENCKEVEREFSAEYDDLISNMNEFSRDMIGLCRSTEEVQILLSKKNGYDKTDKKSYPRLYYAIKHQHKEFIAHPHVQMILYQEWAGEQWPGYRGFSFLQLLNQVIVRILIFPFISVWLTIDDKSKASKAWSCPFSRFLNSLASYLIFLALLVYVALGPINPADPSVSTEPIMATAEWLIFFFVLGHICSMIKQFLFMPTAFLRIPWNRYDIFGQSIWIVTFVCWLISWVFTEGIIPSTKPFEVRKTWNWYHALLLAEGFFAICLVMSFSRLLRLFILHKRLGPLQIALGYMIKTAVTAVILIGLTIFSFASALCYIYKSYISWEKKDPTTGEVTHQGHAFTTFSSAFETLYWALYAMSSWDAGKIIDTHHNHTIKSRHGEEDFTTVVHNHHIVNETAGSIIYALFHIFATVILINTVVALMTGSASVVFDNVEVEWRFARSQMWMFYANDTKVPSPFNIFRLFFAACKGATRKCSGKEKENSNKSKLDKKYAMLTKDLIQRYYREKADANLKEAATSDQVKNLREVVAEIKDKYKTLNEMKQSPAPTNLQRRAPMRRAFTLEDNHERDYTDQILTEFLSLN